MIRVGVLTPSTLGAIYPGQQRKAHNMCPALNKTRYLATAAAVGLFACVQTAAAETAAQPVAVTSTLTAENTLTISYLTPAFGAGTLGVSAAARTLNGGSAWAQAFKGYSAPMFTGRVGVFGTYNQHQPSLAVNPTTSWNFGATVGYAGFYVRGGVNESAPVGPLLGLQGLQAGFGYEIGSFDFRLAYLASQGIGLTTEREIDSHQWSIGGIYQITPRIRVNADAFYGSADENRNSSLAVMPSSAPPGTGARVGVELRF